MPKLVKSSLVVLAIAIAAVAAVQHPGYATDTIEEPSLQFRVYVITDLPIFRQQTDGQYVADTSLVTLLAESTMGDTPGFSLKSHGPDALIVRATAKAHDKFSSILTRLRKAHGEIRTDVE